MAILDLFEDRVRENPYDIYIQSDNIYYTFKEVDNSSNYIATVVDNSSFEIIPIYIKNDILVIPTILGILKSGKIPLPISTDLEFKIAKEQIKDIKYDVLLTDVSDISETILISKNIFDEDWYFSRKQQNNKGCYIVSTSGTTGVPKKVLINEDSLIAVLQTYKNITNFGKDSSFVNTSPYTFDASLFGFFLPIIGGGRSVLFGELGSSSISKVSHTAYLIEKNNATHIFLVPSYAEVLFRTSKQSQFYSLLNVTMGGELFTSSLRNLCRELLPKDVQVLNIYGPSETTIFSLYSEVNLFSNGAIPIGKPIDGVEIRFDEVNIDGKISFELWIGGSTLSNGYCDSSLNFDKFVEFDKLRYYKTGDIVEYDEKGQIFYKGRKDSQVKVNGIRLELDSIDYIIFKSKMVKSSQTLYVNNKLYAFVIKKEEFRDSDVYEYCEKYIRHRINIIFITDFPLTTHQKIDKQQLISYINKRYNLNDDLDKKNKIYGELKEILRKQFSVNDIKDLDSLSTILFFSEIESIYNIEVKDHDIYKLLQLSDLVKFIEKDKTKKEIEVEDPCMNTVNIKELLNIKLNYESFEVDTLYLQKNYRQKKYDEVLFFDISMKDKPIEENYLELKKIVKSLSEIIDIFRLILIDTREELKFQYVKNFYPNIYTSTSFINIKIISENMFYNNGTPLVFINYNVKENVTRFYVSHFLIDQFKLNRLARVVSKIYHDSDELVEQQNFSYIKYIQYVKQKNTKYTLDEIDCLLPISYSIKDSVSKKQVMEKQYLKIELNERLSSTDEYSLLTFYLISQILFIESDIPLITGSMITNIELFNGFDASRVIGDTHSTFPILNFREQSYSDFYKESLKMKKRYEDGLNIRDIIFSDIKYDFKRKEVLRKKWEEMNFSVNYVGSTLNSSNKLTSLFEENYGDKYLLSFTSNGYMYILLPKGLFLKKGTYSIENFKVDVKKLGENYGSNSNKSIF